MTCSGLIYEKKFFFFLDGGKLCLFCFIQWRGYWHSWSRGHLTREWKFFCNVVAVVANSKLQQWNLFAFRCNKCWMVVHQRCKSVILAPLHMISGTNILIITRWAKIDRTVFRVDNFAAVSGRKVCSVSKVSASVIVKLTLFKTSCMSMYDLYFWERYSVTVFNKFRSCYNKC